MSEAEATVTSEATPSTESVMQEVDAEFNINDVLAPIDESASAKADEAPTAEAKPSDEPSTEDKWFEPGKYKTLEDAVRNQDKRFGGLASKIDALTKTIESKLSNPSATIKAEEPVSQSTGEKKTQQEIRDEWTALFATDPVEAMIRWQNTNGGSIATQLEKSVKEKLKAEMIWEDFVEKNPEVNEESTLNTMREVLENFPVINRKKSALVDAKAIALSPGSTIEEKYENWIVNKKNGNGGSRSEVASDPNAGKVKLVIPIATPMPQQTGIDKGSMPKDDSFSLWAKGLDKYL